MIFVAQERRMWYAALDRKMAAAEKDPENAGLHSIVVFRIQAIYLYTTCLLGVSPGLLAKFHAAAGSSKKHRSQN